MAIKQYMNQHSIPQREVVEKTNLNQSHLSQHFTHGVTMKTSKRIKLYHWYEEDQKRRTGKLMTADVSLNSVLESPKVEGTRRRPRWKWSPISTQILTEAFKKNHFPTREQRIQLARICSEAEVAMNNGSPFRRPEGDTEGITDQRVNTWFTNRRKGLHSPSSQGESMEGSLLVTPPHTILTPNTAAVLLPALTPQGSAASSDNASSINSATTTADGLLAAATPIQATVIGQLVPSSSQGEEGGGGGGGRVGGGGDSVISGPQEIHLSVNAVVSGSKGLPVAIAIPSSTAMSPGCASTQTQTSFSSQPSLLQAMSSSILNSNDNNDDSRSSSAATAAGGSLVKVSAAGEGSGIVGGTTQLAPGVLQALITQIQMNHVSRSSNGSSNSSSSNMGAVNFPTVITLPSTTVEHESVDASSPSPAALKPGSPLTLGSHHQHQQEEEQETGSASGFSVDKQFIMSTAIEIAKSMVTS